MEFLSIDSLIVTPAPFTCELESASVIDVDDRLDHAQMMLPVRRPFANSLVKPGRAARNVCMFERISDVQLHTVQDLMKT